MSTATKAPAAPLDPQQRYTVEEAARYLRSSRVSIYKLISAQQITTIREGERKPRRLRDGREIPIASRIFIPGTELVRLSRAPAASVA